MWKRKLNKQKSIFMELKVPGKQAVTEYMDYSTIHGIGRTKNSPYRILKIFWVLALCGSLAMIIYQVRDVYKKYESHPISTSVEVESANSLPFPRVTICNTNPALYSKLDETSDLKLLLEEAADANAIDIEMFNATDMYQFNYSKYDEETKDKNISKDVLWETTELFKMLLSVKDSAYLDTISQPKDEFILLCNFAGEPCSEEAFRTIRTFDYGFCYEFDPALQSTVAPHGEISSAGPRYGLELLMFVDQRDSIPFVVSSAGITITTEKDSMSFHPENGLFIPTGFETNVALRQVDKKRVPGKFAKKRCKEKYPTEGPERVDTLLECRRKCKQEHIFQICNCYQYFFEVGEINESVPLENLRNEATGYRPCYSDKHYKCIQRILNEFTTSTPRVCLECLPPCREVIYKQDVSVATWPGQKYLPILRRIMKSKIKNLDVDSMTRNFVRGNMALARIYFSSLSYKTIKENYAYSEVDFISDIGGQCGLWAGFSVLSMCEVIELCVLLCASLRNKKTSPQEPKEK